MNTELFLDKIIKMSINEEQSNENIGNFYDAHIDNLIPKDNKNPNKSFYRFMPYIIGAIKELNNKIQKNLINIKNEEKIISKNVAKENLINIKDEEKNNFLDMSNYNKKNIINEKLHSPDECEISTYIPSQINNKTYKLLLYIKIRDNINFTIIENEGFENIIIDNFILKIYCNKKINENKLTFKCISDDIINDKIINDQITFIKIENNVLYFKISENFPFKKNVTFYIELN